MPEVGEMCMEPDAPSFGTGDNEKDEAPNKRVKVRLSLFFDGTQNNRFNTLQRRTEKSDPQAAATMARIRDADKKHDSSYFNEYSNVARLDEYVDQASASGYDHYVKVYTEGIGTIDGDTDKSWGVIAGWFGTGVDAKVTKGLANAVDEILQLIKDGTTIELLSVDTFGFSRGAAAARYCAYRVLHTEEITGRLSLKAQLAAFGCPVERVELDTVGVYDTVSALGVAYIDISDVPALKLDSVREARAVLHLAAAEEYRRCFSLTNIQSAVKAGVGHEIFLPGAHSDVGGGYVDGNDEDQVIWTGEGSESLATYLLENGWYRDRELEYRNELVRGRPVEDVRASRRGISFEYSFLPLRGMADFVAERGLNVNGELYKTYNPVNVPSQVRKRVESCIAARKNNKPAEWQVNDAGLRSLRHDFLHFSSQEDWGRELRTLKLDGTKRLLVPTRKVFNG